MFTLKLMRGNNVHQRLIENSTNNGDVLDLKQDLNVCTDLSAGVECRPSAVYCSPMLCSCTKYSTLVLVSLSI